MRRWVAPLAAVAAAMALLAIVAALAGHSPARVLLALLRGAAGSPNAAAESLLKAIPLLFTALAAVLAFRAGVWNIGAEGQLVVGAIAALAVAGHAPVGTLGIVASIGAAALAGAAWAGIALALRLWRNAPEVLTTILLNFAALHLLGWLVNGPLQEKAGRYPQSDPIPAATRLEAWETTRLHAGLWIVLGAALILYLFLFRTGAGLRLRATGLNPSAARWAGVRVKRHVAGAMLASGAIAGAGGAVELLGVTHRLFERFATGAGYSGIAVALLAQLHPLGAIAAALFFGGLAGGAGELQRSENVSAAIAVLTQGATVLILLALGLRTLGAFVAIRPARKDAGS